MNPLKKIKTRTFDTLKKVEFRSKIKSLVNLCAASFVDVYAKARTKFATSTKDAAADTTY